MKSIAILFISVLIGTAPTLAQSMNRFSIQAGYLYSMNTFTRTTNTLVGLPDFYSKPGCYVGLTYEHQVSTLLTGGLELTYQQKGTVGRLPTLNPESIDTYRYVGITPMVGVKLIKNLRFLIGPQLNLLVNQSTKGFDNQSDYNRRFELGLLSRASYQFNRVGLSASYFKGLTAYYKSDIYYLTNQNWQLGLFYQLNKN